MFGTLRGALAARKVQFDDDRFIATVEGRIAGPNKTTIRVLSIVVHYELTLRPQDRDAAVRALRAHPAGCPVHESLQAAIPMSWDATVRLGDEVVTLSSVDGAGSA